MAEQHIYSILVIEDNSVDFEVCRRELQNSRESMAYGVSFQVTQSDSLAGFEALFNSGAYDLILLDLGLPGVDGISALRSVLEVSHYAPVVVITGSDDVNLLREVIDVGAQDYLIKGQYPGLIFRTALNAIRRWSYGNQLEDALADAETANAIKGKFLANVSHEMRTPLTSIIGYSELLQNRNSVCERDRRFLDAVLANGKQLLQVINDILDVSKIEAGGIAIEKESASIERIVNSLKDTFDHQAIVKGLEFEILIDEGVPKYLHTDPFRLKQVIFSLISNALKFTPNGRVEVRVTHDGEMLDITVEDTGIGIPEEALSGIFEAFNQLDNSSERKFGGVGLGLRIASSITEQLEGNLRVETVVGSGSSFTLVVPAIAVSESEIHDDALFEEDKDDLCGTILIVDDCVYNRELLEVLLSSFPQINTVSVTNGLEAVRYVASQECDLVFLDMHMPVMDGYTAVGKIKSMRSELPVVALTASVLLEANKRCIEAGCDEYLQKPFQHDSIVKLVSDYLGATSQEMEVDPELELLCNRFKDKLPDKISAIQSAFDANEIDTAIEHVHKLASAGLFGFDKLGALASQFEVAMKSDMKSVDVGDFMNRLKEEADSLFS